MVSDISSQTLRSILFILLFSGCYYGPGVSRVETEAVRRSARTLHPAPLIRQQSDAVGRGVIAPILDRTLTPLVLGEEANQDPEARRLKDYEENMRRQQEAMDEMDREIEELNRSR